MNFDKILKIIVTIFIIGFIFIKILPTAVEEFGEAKEIIGIASTEQVTNKIINYVESKPDYYFKYDGAVYCITVDELVTNGILDEGTYGEVEGILEVSYYDNSFHAVVNNECVER